MRGNVVPSTDPDDIKQKGDAFCRDHRCSHHIETNADGWADDVRLSDIEPSFVYSVCGKRGAEARPKFSRDRSVSP
jgi:hypothetical protein